MYDIPVDHLEAVQTAEDDRILRAVWIGKDVGQAYQRPANQRKTSAGDPYKPPCSRFHAVSR
jgi:hypothetical protein